MGHAVADRGIERFYGRWQAGSAAETYRTPTESLSGQVAVPRAEALKCLIKGLMTATQHRVLPTIQVDRRGERDLDRRRYPGRRHQPNRE